MKYGVYVVYEAGHDYSENYEIYEYFDTKEEADEFYNKDYESNDVLTLYKLYD